MAGSSVPLAQRRPPLELPNGAKITQAVSIHGGPIESYDFHGLEVLESLIEARHGGEAGISQVQFLEGRALWQAAEHKLWSPELAKGAMEAELQARFPSLQAAIAEVARREEARVDKVHGILLWHRDGCRSIVLGIGRSDVRWNFACTVDGEPTPRATGFYVGPWQNRNLFKALSHAIQTHFLNRRAPYPVERTLLVTGILDAAMTSRRQNGKRMDTPELALAYKARDFRAMREMGATWKIITEDSEPPKGFDPGGR